MDTVSTVSPLNITNNLAIDDMKRSSTAAKQRIGKDGISNINITAILFARGWVNNSRILGKY